MKLRVAVIDDERPALDELCEYLSACEGIQSLEAYLNPVEALEAVKLSQPDVVFLDIYMPQLTGLGFAKELLKFCPDTDTVFVTAYKKYAAEAFEANASDYLLKPINPLTLQKTVEKLFSKRNPA